MPSPIASREDWLKARKALMEREKALTRERDAISAELRALPRIRIDKSYAFAGADGTKTLAEIFGTSSQLIVYHFMYGADWEAGCKSCSFWADIFDGIAPHLAARDTAFVATSTAPFSVLDAYQKRMGWSFRWYSSGGSDFNRDFDVTFDEDQLARKDFTYNFRRGAFGGQEAPGLSVFCRGADGVVYHTYSLYARGLESFNAAYLLLDMTPKGRDEDGLDYTMAWLRRHDEYGAA